MSEELKNYAIFEYVYDPVAQQDTAIEGKLVGYVKADDPFDACEKLGFPDANKHFARLIEKLEEHEKNLIADSERVKKLHDQLQPMIDERKQEVADRKCPNCGAKLDEEYNCPSCHFGHEAEEMKKALKEAKKLAKKVTKKAKK